MNKYDKITMKCGKVALEGRPRQDSIEEVRNFNNIVFYKAKGAAGENYVRRMAEWIGNKDCAVLTFPGNAPKDCKKWSGRKTAMGCEELGQCGHQLTREEGRHKTKIMVAELMIMGYGVTKVKSVYPERVMKEGSGEGCLVVNLDDDKNFRKNIQQIAEYYNQDAIIYKGRGVKNGHIIVNNCAARYECHEEGENCTLKHGRKQGLAESVRFWRKNVKERMQIKEDLHPMTRMVMCSELKRFKESTI